MINGLLDYIFEFWLAKFNSNFLAAGMTGYVWGILNAVFAFLVVYIVHLIWSHP